MNVLGLPSSWLKTNFSPYTKPYLSFDFIWFFLNSWTFSWNRTVGGGVLAYTNRTSHTFNVYVSKCCLQCKSCSWDQSLRKAFSVNWPKRSTMWWNSTLHFLLFPHLHSRFVTPVVNLYVFIPLYSYFLAQKKKPWENDERKESRNAPEEQEVPVSSPNPSWWDKTCTTTKGNAEECSHVDVHAGALPEQHWLTNREVGSVTQQKAWSGS